MDADKPRIIFTAGPNGAGKTTFARAFLPGEAACPVFVNADLIAAGLAPFAPDTASLQAGRLMLQELARYFAARASFAFETTLSGRGYARLIKEWQAAGYSVKDVIGRRFIAGRDNFERLYSPLVDSRARYDNAGDIPVLMDWSEKS